MVLAGDMTSYFSLACAVVSACFAGVTIYYAYILNQPFGFIRAGRPWISNPRAKALKVRRVTYAGREAQIQSGHEKGRAVFAKSKQISMIADEICFPGTTEPLCLSLLLPENISFEVKISRAFFLNGNIFDVRISSKESSQ